DAMRAYHEYFETITRKAPGLMREHHLVSRVTWGGWWEAQIRVIPLLYPPEVLAEGQRLIAQAEEAVEGGTDREKERVAVVARGLHHTALMADAFRKLRLHDPTVSPREGNPRAALKPLWEFRKKHPVEIGQSYLTLTMQEQRS